MTCRPDGEPPKDFEGNIYKTNCYKCGRPMHFVRGSRIQPDGTKKPDWILDQEWWTAKAFNELWGDEAEKINIEVDVEPPHIPDGRD